MLHFEFDNLDHIINEVTFDNMKLKALLGFLKCPVFEKKLYAINKLSELKEHKIMTIRKLFSLLACDLF